MIKKIVCASAILNAKKSEIEMILKLIAHVASEQRTQAQQRNGEIDFFGLKSLPEEPSAVVVIKGVRWTLDLDLFSVQTNCKRGDCIVANLLTCFDYADTPNNDI